MANRPTPGNDRIRGSNLADNIDALAGNDTIFGLAGEDTLSGGAGNDKVFGGLDRDIAIRGYVRTKLARIKAIAKRKKKCQLLTATI